MKEILINEKYVGNMLLQKYYRQDPIGKRKMKNQGKLPKYFVEQSHEAIISADLFEKSSRIGKRTDGTILPSRCNEPLSAVRHGAVCSLRKKLSAENLQARCGLDVCNLPPTRKITLPYGKTNFRTDSA